MLRLPALCLAALLAVAALPAAQAQAGANDPKITVTVEVTPKAPVIPLGGSQDFKVDVKLATTGVYCTNQGSVTVQLALKDTALPGIAGSLPASVDVPIAANVQPPNMVTSNTGGNNTAKLTVTVAASTAPDHDHAFTITATTPAALPSGCQSLSASPPPSASASAEATLRTGPGNGSTVTTTGGVSVNAGNCSASVSAPGVNVNAAAACPTSNKSFFLPLQVQVLVLLLVGLLGRKVA